MLQKSIVVTGSLVCVFAMLVACNGATSNTEAISGVAGGAPGVNTQGGGGVPGASCAPGVDCSAAYTQQDNMSPCTTKTSSTPSLNGDWQLSRSYSDGHTEVTTLSISASKMTVSNTCVYGNNSATAKVDDVNILESNGKIQITDGDSDTKKNVTDSKGTVHVCEAKVAQGTYGASFINSCLAMGGATGGKALEFVPSSAVSTGN